MQVAFKIRDAAKANDPGAALAAYDAAVVEGIPLRPESFNSLLYLCAGGEHWAMPGDAAQRQVAAPYFVGICVCISRLCGFACWCHSRLGVAEVVVQRM